MSAPTHIAVLDDEVDITRLLAGYLQAQGFRVTQLHSGAALMDTMREDAPALVLLDLGLPGEDGFGIARQLREHWHCGLVIVTGRGDAVDKVVGLEVGADDYVCKPYSPREVVARVHAVLRRHRRPADAAAVPGLQIDEAACRATWQGRDIELTPVEFRLLHALAAAPGRVYSRDQLLDRLYTDHRVVTDRTVDSHVRNLRRKLADIGGGNWIRSIYGLGYRFDGDA